MDIGFYLTTATDSIKCNQIIKTMNDMISDHPYDNIILFNGTYNRIDPDKKFPIIHLSQAKYFRGILLVFDATSAMITRTFPSPKKQIFYIDDLFWMKDLSIPAAFWNSIFSNEDILKVSSRSDITDIIEICWNKPEYQIEEIESKRLYDVCQNI